MVIVCCQTDTLSIIFAEGHYESDLRKLIFVGVIVGQTSVWQTYKEERLCAEFVVS